jgi:hypothetical protein
MTLPVSGPISFCDVNVELGNTSTDPLALASADVRTLFGVASGAISMSDGYGCANIPKPEAGDLGVYCSDWGGYYTGVLGSNYLFTDQTTVGRQYKTVNGGGGGASHTDGYTNTYNNNTADFPSMCYAGNLSSGGFTDWFVAGLSQLSCQWANRNCGTIPSYGSGGYWSSTELNGYRAWGICFATGSSNDCASPRKECTCCTRAMRQLEGA